MTSFAARYQQLPVKSEISATGFLNLFNFQIMENNTNLFESLLENTAEYGKTSIELAKLKVLDKTADVVSSLIPNTIVLGLITAFILFITMGLAIYLGDILGKMYFGFFVIAAFYGIAGIFIHFIMHKWIKRNVCDSIIKNVLK
jgi:hypothetical protein